MLFCYMVQADFKQLLSEMGRKGFVEQLTMVLHQVSTLVFIPCRAHLNCTDACSFQEVTISHGLRRKC